MEKNEACVDVKFEKKAIVTGLVAFTEKLWKDFDVILKKHVCENSKSK